MKQQKYINFREVFIFAKVLLVIAWMLFIVVIMTKPFAVADNLEEQFTLYDKIAHILMFGGMSLLLLLLWQEFRWFSFRRASWLTIGLAFTFAYLMEYVQQFIPGRMSNIWDLLFGVLGVLVAILIFYIYFHQVKPKLLLHVCCATCGAYVSQLLSKEFEVTLYYYNPNIFPKQELDKRLIEVKKISKTFGFPLIVDKYDHRRWLKAVKGHEKDPEKGQRCCICYQFRLDQVFKQAQKHKFNYVATTLSVSPHKLAKVINQQGKDLEKKIGIKFLDRDFKKQDGFKKSMELSKKFNFYRQDYCGCEFSRRK